MKLKFIHQHCKRYIFLLNMLFFILVSMNNSAETHIDAPEALTAEKLNAHNFTARWKTVLGATGYQLAVSDGNVWRYYDEPTTQHLVTDLIAGRKYQYKVRAKSGSTFSVFSNVIDVITVYPPIATEATDITTTSFTANWNPVQGTIIGYRLCVESLTHPNFNPIGYPIDLTNTKHAVTGLYIGHKYKFYVLTVTSLGITEMYNSIEFETKTQNPVANEATEITSTSFKASWSEVPQVIRYKLYVWVKGDTKYVNGYDGKETTGTSEKVTGLMPGTEYRYNVKAVFQTSESGGSNYVNLKTSTYAFIKYKLTLISLPSTSGEVSGGGEFFEGTNVTVIATPNAGYEFADWSEGTHSVSTQSTYTFILTANQTLTANFKSSSATYLLSLSANPAAGGSVKGSGTFLTGKTITAIATPNPGYQFVNWSENGIPVSASATYSFAITKNTSLAANFKLATSAFENHKNSFKAYPNPVTDNLVISGLKGKETIRISNAAGQIIYSATGFSHECQPVSFAGFPRGMYRIEVLSDKSVYAVKIIKQ